MRLQYRKLMHQRWIIALVITAVLGIGIGIALRSGRDPGEVATTRMPGDVTNELQAIEPDQLLARARAYLSTDRPWRAAYVMRRYFAERDSITDDLRVLAARAEAGWGAWPEVRTLLSNVKALESFEQGIGLFLLARAHEENGDVGSAAALYRRYLAVAPPTTEPAQRAAARLRLALALIAAGRQQEAAPQLAELTAQAGNADVWIELLAANALALAGDTAGVRNAVADHDEGIPGLHAWRARIAAATRAEDLPTARALAVEARKWAETDGTRAEFLVAEARAALAEHDSARARAALREAIARTQSGAAAREAAELLQQGELTPQEHLVVARVQSAQGLHEEAVAGYRRWLNAQTGSQAQRDAVHMEHARALFYAERYGQVEAALQPIMNSVAARMLHARAESTAGNLREAVRIYSAIANKYPKSSTGAHALFLVAGAYHDEGELAEARTYYRRVISQYPGTSQSSLAMMRLAGIAYMEKDYREAARIWDQYRARYPRGQHILEAMYWSGRARQQAGDSAAAATLFRQVREKDRDSYHALKASEQLNQPFWPLPTTPSPPVSAAATRQVNQWMRTVDMLRAADFPDHAAAEAERIVAAAGRDRDTRYALAEALAARGYTRSAIRIGLALQQGEPNLRVLRILYPFPYRTLITEEARARDLDPFIAAALIRQESMFEARITSAVGARGLMQIMPATGAKLAEAAGMEDWDAELLYYPEINVHLGTRYLSQHMQNYDNSLPSVFSAYNAGAHRVEWWSDFGEYQDEELFTERIPYAETRGYVRILTRNRAIYDGLYGDR